MDSGFGLIAAISMLGSGFIVALGPSLSSLLVASRSSTLGFANGIFAAAGVVTGDLVLLSAAMFGLVAGTSTFELLDPIIQFAGGGFLIWLGVRALATVPRSGTNAAAISNDSGASSFVAGLLLTLADLKAIAFYFAFLPAFIDLGTATSWDMLAIAGVVIVSVGGAKLVWAYAGGRTGSALPASARVMMQRLGGAVLLVIGGILLLGAHS